jgi:uncharacterized protein
MKTQILFIHGAGGGAHKADEKLVASLQDTLGPEYQIRYPAMKNEEEADHETWRKQIEQELTKIAGPVILVGHSVGASTILKSLTEMKVRNTIPGIFLIAAPFWGGDSGWTYEGYEALVLTKKLEAKLPPGARVFLYHSHDDETVPFTHLGLYAQLLPHATVRELDGRGHQLNDDLSEVASDIRKLKLPKEAH